MLSTGGISAHDIFYYSKSIGETVRVFNKENIRRGFENSPMLETLLALETAIRKEGFNWGMKWRQFFKARKLVEEYLQGFISSPSAGN